MRIDRRRFLQAAAALGTMPLLSPRFAFADAGSVASDTLIVVFLRGGMDGLNVVVPYGDADYYRLRPTIGVPRPGSGATAALDLDGYFGLHPDLSALIPLYRAGRLAAVHATGYSQDSRSHFACQDGMERAGSSVSVSDGWLNRFLQTQTTVGTFDAIAIGGGVQGALRGAVPPIGIATLAAFGLETTSSNQGAIEATLHSLFGGADPLATSARGALTATAGLAAANPLQYPVDNGAVYPDGEFATQMREVAQLIKADVGLRVACVDLGGWDHHDNEAQYLAPLMTELATTLAAFDTDLGARMARTTVITMTEFGRRASENASQGTDHGTAYGMFLLGGGVNGGQVIADWPGLASGALADGDLAVTLDYRDVLADLLQRRMGGTDPAHVFPGFAVGPWPGAFAPIV